MKSLITLLLSLAAVVWIRYDIVCRMLPAAPAASVAPLELPRTSDLTLLLDGRDTLLTGLEQFAYIPFADTLLLNADNRQAVIKAFAYLNQHPNAGLLIDGAYLSSEADSTSGFFENLGLARAADLRRRLTSRGIAPYRIRLDSHLSEEATQRAIQMYVFSDARRIAAPGYSRDTMTFAQFTFDYEAQTFVPSLALDNYIDAIAQQDPAPASMLIVGHTDDSGTPSLNQKIGLARAEAAKNYILSRTSMQPQDITTQSAGATQLLTSQNDPNPQEKNRRIDIILR